MPFRRLIVAYDFSEPAARCLSYVAQLANKLDAELHLVHVHQNYEAPDVPAGVPWPTAEQTERYLLFLQDELRRAAEAVCPERIDKIRYHVLRGDPVRDLERAAAALAADLICVGATGKRAVERLLLGSVAQSILRTSPVPVLSVH